MLREATSNRRARTKRKNTTKGSPLVTGCISSLLRPCLALTGQVVLGRFLHVIIISDYRSLAERNRLALWVVEESGKMENSHKQKIIICRSPLSSTECMSSTLTKD